MYALTKMDKSDKLKVLIEFSEYSDVEGLE